MYLMICNYQIKKGCRGELLEHIQEKKLEERFSSCPGCLEYVYLIPPNRADELRVFERFADKECFERHKTCRAAEDWRAISRPYILERDNHGYDLSDTFPFAEEAENTKKNE